MSIISCYSGCNLKKCTNIDSSSYEWAVCTSLKHGSWLASLKEIWWESMKYRRLGNYKVKKIMMCFCEDLTASTTAKMLSINRNTINAYFNEFRVKILENSLKEHSKEFGVFEHNMFWARWKLLWCTKNSWKNGRAGSRWKNTCFWLAKIY